MARVDFYVLKQSGERARQMFACRLAEKAYRLDNTVHIEAASPADIDVLDQLLWTFRDGSFVPHHALTGPDKKSPVTIGFETAELGDTDLLINLSAAIPGIAARFPRIAELVSSDDDSKLASRQRYTQYREQGHTIDTHKI